MFIMKDEMQHVAKEKLRNGEGILDMMHIVSPEQLYGAGSMVAVVTAPVGASVGVHDHVSNFEIYYILEGKAEVEDGGETRILLPGDAEICAEGNTHAIKNIGDTELKFLACILNNFTNK